MQSISHTSGVVSIENCFEIAFLLEKKVDFFSFRNLHLCLVILDEQESGYLEIKIKKEQ